MKSCSVLDESKSYSDQGSSLYAAAALFFAYPLFGALFFFCGFRSFIASPKSLFGIIELVLGIVCAILTCYYGFCSLNEASARYRIDSEGIFIKYIFFKEIKKIPWEYFQQICICYTDISPVHRNTVICCVRNGEKRNWKNRWKTDNVFCYQKLITIAYSEDRLNEFRQICPLIVIDLRGTAGYR